MHLKKQQNYISIFHLKMLHWLANKYCFNKCLTKIKYLGILIMLFIFQTLLKKCLIL